MGSLCEHPVLNGNNTQSRGRALLSDAKRK
jgi:hypothetical protein